MNEIRWIFDGIGTAIVSFVLGTITGSSITYIVIKRGHAKMNNIQKAGKQSTQIQVNSNENKQ